MDCCALSDDDDVDVDDNVFELEDVEIMETTDFLDSVLEGHMSGTFQGEASTPLAH